MNEGCRAASIGTREVRRATGEQIREVPGACQLLWRE